MEGTAIDTADAGAGFSGDESAGGDVPAFGAAGPVAIQTTGGDIAEVEGGGAHATKALAAFHDGEELLDLVGVPCDGGWEAGGDEGTFEDGFTAALEPFAVEEGATIERSFVEFAGGGIVNHAHANLLLVNEGDGDGEVKHAVGVVGGTVQGIDDPAGIFFGPLSVRGQVFFADPMKGGEVIEEASADEGLRGDIGIGDEIAISFFADGDIGHHLHEECAGFEGRLFGLEKAVSQVEGLRRGMVHGKRYLNPLRHSGRILHHLKEVIEEIVAIVRSGGSFRMVLDAEGWKLAMSDAGDGLVVEVAVGNFEVGREARFIDGEAMVLSGDFDAAVAESEDGLVRAAVAELHLESLGTAGQRKELMTEADAKDRAFAEEGADGGDGIFDGFGVTGSIAEEDAVRVLIEDLLRRRITTEDSHAVAFIGKVATDIAFHAKVEANDVERTIDAVKVISMDERVKELAPFAGALRHDFFGEIATDQTGALFGEFDQAGWIEFGGRDDPFEDTAGAQVTYQGAGIDVGDPDDLVSFEVFLEGALGAKIAVDAARLFDDEAGELGMWAFFVVEIDAIVANEWVGHGDDLTAVAGVGQNLLIAGHRRIEADFADGLSGGTKGRSSK